MSSTTTRPVLRHPNPGQVAPAPAGAADETATGASPGAASDSQATAATARIAIAGCGVVGGALIRLMADRAPSLGIARVLVRDAARARSGPIETRALTTSLAAFLREDGDVVVEAIGGIEPALEIARSTLGRGAHFVTANKALVAAHGPELHALAEAAGGVFRFEGAVGGGVPVVRAVRDAFRPIGIRSIRGVLNGTCNYVLGRMESGVEISDAVREAQHLGYAEADPSRDLDGRDAEDKVRILAWQAWGVDPTTLRVRRSGLLPDPAPLLRDARRNGRAVRLVGECRRKGRDIVARVGLEALEPTSELAAAAGVQNRIVVETGDGQVYTLGGPGAGGEATAAAVLGDVLEAVRWRS